MSGQADPASDRQRRHRAILSLLALNPARAYRPAEVAQALDLTTHKAATTLYDLAAAGKITRPARGTYQARQDTHA